MRLPLIAGNWKMNTTVPEAVALVTELRNTIRGVYNTEVLVCPPFVSLSAVGDALKDSQIMLGAQNLFYEEKGAFTIVGPLKEEIRRNHQGQYLKVRGRIVEKPEGPGLHPNLEVLEILEIRSRPF